MRKFLLSTGLRLDSGVPVLTIFISICVLLIARIWIDNFLDVNRRATRLLDGFVVGLIVLFFLFVGARFVTLA